MTMHPEIDLHRPTDAFADYLEGEVMHSLRRGRAARRLRAAAVILVGIGIGATATLGSAQVRENAQRDSLLQVAKAELAMLALRLELARAQLDQERAQVQAGARSNASTTDLQVRALEIQVQRIQLNAQEIEATSLPPRDELNAPLVKGRDFVKARLQIELMGAQQRLDAAERERADVDRRVRVGATSSSEAIEPELALARARRDFTVLAERMRARDELLARGTSVEELTRRLERTEVQQEIQYAQRALSLASTRLASLEKQRKVGAATTLEVLKADVELSELQLAMRLLGQRLQQLGKPPEP